MRLMTDDELDLFDTNGWRVIYLKHFALIRKYSVNAENFWKRHCPIYDIVRMKRVLNKENK